MHVTGGHQGRPFVLISVKLFWPVRAMALGLPILRWVDVGQEPDEVWTAVMFSATAHMGKVQSVPIT